MTTSPVSSTAAALRDDVSLKSSSSSTADTSFEQQLSGAISDSLRTLGKTPGEIRINVRNGDTPATRQFIITYGTNDTTTATASTAPATTSTPAVTTPAPTGMEGAVSTAPNPFDGSNNPGNRASEASGGGPAMTPTTPTTSWSPWNGPRDIRDGVPAGGGQRTASGAPLIELNATPTSNQYGYTGPAALNPYFTNPGNPLREGYVLGFEGWFQSAQIIGPGSSSVSANELNYASDDGANEALRLVQQYEPGAQLTSKTWGGGPFTATRPMWMVSLPNGSELNAGNVLNAYYNHGSGVCISSDKEIENAVRTA